MTSTDFLGAVIADAFILALGIWLWTRLGWPGLVLVVGLRAIFRATLKGVDPV
jgi:hypothetical protein